MVSAPLWAFRITIVVGLLVTAKKKDRFGGLLDDGEEELDEETASLQSEMAAVNRMSLMQVGLKTQAGSKADASSKLNDADLGKTLSAAEVAALAVAKDVSASAVKLSSEAAAVVQERAMDVWSKASHELQPKLEGLVENGNASSPGFHDDATNQSNVMRKEDLSVADHPDANDAEQNSQEQPGFFRRALKYIKEFEFSWQIPLRVTFLLFSCLLVRLLYQQITLQKLQQEAAALKKKLKLEKHRYGRTKNKDTKRKQKPAGRESYQADLHPDHPNLYEPSPFHEDRDTRRALGGGE